MQYIDNVYNIQPILIERTLLPCFKKLHFVVK